jgi:hypothetical protein
VDQVLVIHSISRQTSVFMRHGAPRTASGSRTVGSRDQVPLRPTVKPRLAATDLAFFKGVLIWRFAVV